ncbi:hypothetical protein IQ16_07606 [Bradyrhizobium huanghuaihaiense]|uniref:Uncharacterized protein n=1 Tax=Bradyrhizobium huanghuaihaiense TaxID=990078 RepID=A0A562QWG9_9BRAD|nr:hypothetical protein [Bradyrhizobium huanghuaihaiense]TWI60486.1 hypothetical protein IQ16_07606 [Bradyrhizobium huanghuaihaiense]
MKVIKILSAAVLVVSAVPAKGQTDATNNKLLYECVKAADEKYKMTWSTLCSQGGGKGGYCPEFIGSPKDVQFSQLRNEEKALCAKLYK